MTQDTLMLGGKEFHSRFILGSGKYSLELIQAAVNQAGAEMVTLAVRRTNTKDTENILDYIPEHVTLLPNTSGARDAKEAGLRKFCKSGDYEGQQISASG